MDPDVLSSGSLSHMIASHCFSPLMSPVIFLCFKIKWISFFICHLFFLMWKCRICYKKEKNQTLYDRHNPVQVCDLYGMTRYESFNSYPTTTYHTVSSSVWQSASSFSYATASHTKWMVTRPVWWDVRIIVTLWTPFSSFIHSFNQINWVWFVGDVFLSLP